MTSWAQGDRVAVKRTCRYLKADHPGTIVGFDVGERLALVRFTHPFEARVDVPDSVWWTHSRGDAYASVDDIVLVERPPADGIVR